MYPTQAVIDRQALKDNLSFFRQQLGDTQPVPIVKSDAYGHGAAEATRAFAAAGARQCAVFRVDEALSLREAGVDIPLWVLLGALPHEADRAVGQRLTLAVWSLEQARALHDAALRHHTVQDIHLALDTGLGRLGFLPADLPRLLPQLAALPALRITGAFSHMACAGQPDHPTTRQQLRELDALLPLLPPGCTQVHAYATAAILEHYKPILPFARPGIGLYGLWPDGVQHPTHTLTPALTFKSAIVSLKRLPAGAAISYGSSVVLSRDSLVAIAPVGYASGLPRILSRQCQALVRGRRVSALGTICMDMTMFDLTDVPDAAIDDDIILIGRQGHEEITAWDLAHTAQTNAYEILCHIGMTQPRTYIN